MTKDDLIDQLINLDADILDAERRHHESCRDIEQWSVGGTYRDGCSAKKGKEPAHLQELIRQREILARHIESIPDDY